jgi:hypothetical protein
MNNRRRFPPPWSIEGHSAAAKFGQPGRLSAVGLDSNQGRAVASWR